MNKTIAAALLAALLSQGLLAGDFVPKDVPLKDDPDTISRFAGLALLNVPACAAVAAVLVEDLPTAGFENRFSFTLTPIGAIDDLAICLGRAPRGAIPVRMAAVADGSMAGEVSGWVRLRVVPGSPEIQRLMTAAAPGSEERMQFVRLERRAGRLVILIEEPVAR